MTTLLVYICVSRGRRSQEFASRFVQSYQRFPPGIPHELVIVFNGGKPHPRLADVFKPIPHGFHERNNGAFDIGAYLDVASRVNPDLMVCLGESVYAHHSGWLTRLADARSLYGPGMYGIFSSYLVSPHLNTTAFAVSPQLLRAWPTPVRTRKDRYNFEHGPNSFWRWLSASRYPTKLVTWDGEWDQPDWRKPNDILWRGDQRNCLLWSNHTDRYALSSAEMKERWAAGADALPQLQTVRTYEVAP